MEYDEFKAKTRKNWVVEATPMPLVITALAHNKDNIELELVDTSGTLWYKEISTHEYSKAYNFLKYAFGADTKAWQGRKLTFGRVEKYFLPVRAE